MHDMAQFRWLSRERHAGIQLESMLCTHSCSLIPSCLLGVSSERSASQKKTREMNDYETTSIGRIRFCCCREVQYTNSGNSKVWKVVNSYLGIFIYIYIFFEWGGSFLVCALFRFRKIIHWTNVGAKWKRRQRENKLSYVRKMNFSTFPDEIIVNLFSHLKNYFWCG